jgi:hypothetical protein
MNALPRDDMSADAFLANDNQEKSPDELTTPRLMVRLPTTKTVTWGDMIFRVPEQHCEEQAKLAHAVVVAKNNAYNAKSDLDDAKEKKMDMTPFVAVLNNARAIQRRASAALNKHKLEHKCLNIAGRTTAL